MTVAPAKARGREVRAWPGSLLPAGEAVGAEESDQPQLGGLVIGAANAGHDRGARLARSRGMWLAGTGKASETAESHSSVARRRRAGRESRLSSG